MITFVLGGARSGKSTYAQHLAASAEGRVLFVATAQALDEDMQQRITRHQEERPATWDTLEVPLKAAPAVAERLRARPVDVILFDCVTLLASNVLLALPEDAGQAEVDAAILAEVDALLALAAESKVHWVIVSNEVGLGVVPATRLGRFFRDALGRANQRIAASADEVILMVAGLPWRLGRAQA